LKHELFSALKLYNFIKLNAWKENNNKDWFHWNHFFKFVRSLNLLLTVTVFTIHDCYLRGAELCVILNFSQLSSVLGIRNRIRMFLGLPDPDP
jgi:hypothetical protein